MTPLPALRRRRRRGPGVLPRVRAPAPGRRPRRPDAGRARARLALPLLVAAVVAVGGAAAAIALTREYGDRDADRHGNGRQRARHRRRPSRPRPQLEEWPADRSGWTNVLVSVPKVDGRDAAVARAEQARRQRACDASACSIPRRYASLHPGYWVVFAGVYPSEPEATSRLREARRRCSAALEPQRVSTLDRCCLDRQFRDRVCNTDPNRVDSIANGWSFSARYSAYIPRFQRSEIRLMEDHVVYLQSCMYQYSRAIYRSIKDLIDPYTDRHTRLESRRAVLEECELTMSRLAADPQYFARPDRALFQDIRRYFPITAQAQVAWAVREGRRRRDRVHRAADRGRSVRRRHRSLQGDDAQGQGVPADAAAEPRLLPVAPASRSAHVARRVAAGEGCRVRLQPHPHGNGSDSVQAEARRLSRHRASPRR